MDLILAVDNISKHFRGLKALVDYSLRLEKNGIVGLIGPNGAGKTTVFNVLTGIYQPNGGTIRLDGQDITGFSPDRVASLGLARTFQNLRLFKELPVIDNVLIGAQMHKQYSLLSTIACLPSFFKNERELREKAMDILDVMGLAGDADQLAGNLPYGAQRKLEIARALATNPKVLLLDEPAAGMNPKESKELIHTIRRLRNDFNLTVLLIEHDMRVVMNLCEQIQVLSYGEIIAEGQPAEIQSNAQVIEAYLGRAASGA